MLSNEFFSLSEYTKIDVVWGFALDRPTGGASLQRSPDLLAGFKGPLCGRRRMEGMERPGGGEREREGKWGREGKWEVGGIAPLLLGIDAPADRKQ